MFKKISAILVATAMVVQLSTVGVMASPVAQTSLSAAAAEQTSNTAPAAGEQILNDNEAEQLSEVVEGLISDDVSVEQDSNDQAEQIDQVENQANAQSKKEVAITDEEIAKLLPPAGQPITKKDIEKFIVWAKVAATEQAEKGEQSQNDVLFKYLQALMNYVLSNYRFDTSVQLLEEGAIRGAIGTDEKQLENAIFGMFAVLDENSGYMYKDRFGQFTDAVTGKTSGIGVQLSIINKKVVVVNVIDNTPAKRIGIKLGDVVLTVNDISTDGKTIAEITDAIRGEKGSIAKLEIKREGEREAITYSVIRDIIKVNLTSVTFANDKTAVLKVSGFNENIAENVAERMKEIDAKGVKNVVLDLRENLGGPTDQAIALASVFVPKGKIIYSNSFKDEKFNVTYYSKAEFDKAPYNVAILTDGFTASSSEIVSAAIRENNVGILVGETTYGKGTTQQLIPLATGGGVRLTVSEYLTPNGKSIHKKGLAPDIAVVNKKTAVDMTKFAELSMKETLKFGDSGQDVFAAKQRLAFLGYFVGERNDKFNESTADAVAQFQQESGLYSYGVLDRTTALRLQNAVRDTQIVVDGQLDAAIDALAKGIKK